MEEEQDYTIEEVARTFSDGLKTAYRTCIRPNAVSRVADPELIQQFGYLVISHLDAWPSPAWDDQEEFEIPEQQARDTFEYVESTYSIHNYMTFLSALVAHLMENDPALGRVGEST